MKFIVIEVVLIDLNLIVVCCEERKHRRFYNLIYLFLLLITCTFSLFF